MLIVFFKTTKINKIQIIKFAIRHQNGVFKLKNIDWRKIALRFKPYDVSKHTCTKVAVKLSFEYVAEINTVRGMMHVGLSDLVTKTGRTISMSEIMTFCLIEATESLRYSQ